MAEEKRANQSGGESPRERRVLLVMIITNPSTLDQLVTTLVDLGVASTIVESKGLMSILREEMPIFGGLTSLLPQTSGTRMAFSVTSEETADSVFRFIEERFKKAERPIALTLPVERLIGMRR